MYQAKEIRCLNRKTIGIDVNGGFAEYMLVLEQSVKLGHVVKLPDMYLMKKAH